jgi:hypothetical protein
LQTLSDQIAFEILLRYASRKNVAGS